MRIHNADLLELHEIAPTNLLGMRSIVEDARRSSLSMIQPTVRSDRQRTMLFKMKDVIAGQRRKSIGSAVALSPPKLAAQMG